MIKVKNIVLIGMPGAGKSTVGVLLAKSLLMDFTDTDLIIQRKTKKALSDIINESGTAYFIKTEEQIILGENFSNTVIATGGSAVYGERAMKKLKENGICVYLKVAPSELIKRLGDITTRGIAMEKGKSILSLYEERAPLYEKYADITFESTGKAPEECVKNIFSLLENR